MERNDEFEPGTDTARFRPTGAGRFQERPHTPEPPSRDFEAFQELAGDQLPPHMRRPAPVPAPHEESVDRRLAQGFAPSREPDPEPPKPHPNLPRVQVMGPEDLPSRLLPYPEGSTICYRPYTFGEVKRISQEKVKFAELARGIMTGLETAPFPVTELTFFDFLYLNLLRKISTVGDSRVTVYHTCMNPECKARNAYPVWIRGENCEIAFHDLETPELPVEVDFSWGTYRFMPLTIGQYLDLDRQGRHKDDAAVLAVECVDLPFAEAYDLFSNAVGDDAMALAEVENLLFHGVEPIVGTCGQCGFQNRIRIEGGAVLVRPFRDEGASLAGRIRFGKAPGLASAAH